MVSRILKLFRRGSDEVDCGHVRGLSSDYIDNELDPKERDRVRAHLEWCGLCLAFINTLRATVSLLGSSEPPKPPPNLKDRIRANLSQDHHS